MQNFEVEIKSLLGSKEKADALLGTLKATDHNVKLLSKNKQLNHYFVGGDIHKLAVAVAPHLSPGVQKKLQDLAARASTFSIRSRDKDGAVLLVVKASVGDDTSANGVMRMEFEEPVNLTLEQLDRLLLKAGFRYQAKWSREREEWLCKGVTVCLDKNAGYGWLAEFEKVVPSPDLLDTARAEIIELMSACGVEELPQDRLERMFAHYNAHWPEYYGTEKIFTVN